MKEYIINIFKKSYKEYYYDNIEYYNGYIDYINKLNYNISNSNFLSFINNYYIQYIVRTYNYITYDLYIINNNYNENSNNDNENSNNDNGKYNNGNNGNNNNFDSKDSNDKNINNELKFEHNKIINLAYQNIYFYIFVLLFGMLISFGILSCCNYKIDSKKKEPIYVLVKNEDIVTKDENIVTKDENIVTKDENIVIKDELDDKIYEATLSQK